MVWTMRFVSITFCLTSLFTLTISEQPCIVDETPEYIGDEYFKAGMAELPVCCLFCSHLSFDD